MSAALALSAHFSPLTLHIPGGVSTKTRPNSNEVVGGSVESLLPNCFNDSMPFIGHLFGFGVSPATEVARGKVTTNGFLT